MAEAVEDAFRYGKLVLATTTYNAEIFPFMNEFIDHLVERNFQKRTVGLIENGSWSPIAAKIMKGKLENSKDINFIGPTVKIKSAVNDENMEQLEELANELCRDYVERASETANKNDMTALFRIGYGLYVVTSNDGKHDNGLIVNTVTQVAENPNRIAVNINKANYSHHVIKQTGVMNVNCLSVDAPFKVLKPSDSRADVTRINSRERRLHARITVLLSCRSISMHVFHLRLNSMWISEHTVCLSAQ